MKNVKIHYIFLFLVVLIASSCRNFERDANRFQKALNEQVAKAEQTTDQLALALHNATLDSVRQLTKVADPCLFYVFDKKGLVYWSDNWLAAPSVYLNRYNDWQLYRFDNAICLGRWTQAEAYNILTVIPLKFNYSLENWQLRNEFLPPFRMARTVQIRQSKGLAGSRSISVNGKHVFSLIESPATDTAEVEQQPLAESFTYHHILNAQGNKYEHHTVVHYYTLFAGIFIALILCVGVYGLIRNRGIRDMRIGTRYQYLLATILLASFIYVFIVSTNYFSDRQQDRQESELLQRARYVQKSLQDLYFWNLELSPRNTAGLNVDLRDLCFTYETDIHVYDANGDLVGSSSPALFDKGIISRHMASEPFFSGASNVIVREHIGEMNYLAAYVEFVNGNYVPIGYIEVPCYVSDDERHAAVDYFLARLFPPYFLVMMFSLIIGLILARQVTRPLTELADSMKRFRVGQRNAHLEYKRKDEVGELVQDYNRILDELEVSTDRLARSEREGAWRTMARQIAHEINNPLTPMRLQIQQLQRLHQMEDERFDATFRRSSTALIEQIDQLARIASSFSTFAKQPEVHATNVDVAAQLTSVITIFRTNIQKIPVRYIGAEYGVYAQADGEQLRQVFTNLIKNALQAIGDSPKGDIIVILKDLERSVEITVSDNGPGISDEVRDKIFMPNFTTKSTGTGLGLAISKNIVEGSGGAISFETSPQGTTFKVVLRK